MELEEMEIMDFEDFCAWTKNADLAELEDAGNAIVESEKYKRAGGIIEHANIIATDQDMEFGFAELHDVCKSLHQGLGDLQDVLKYQRIINSEIADKICKGLDEIMPKLRRAYEKYESEEDVCVAKWA